MFLLINTALSTQYYKIIINIKLSTLWFIDSVICIYNNLSCTYSIYHIYVPVNFKIEMIIIFKFCCCIKAKEFGRRAVVASESLQDESLSRDIIELMKVCERVN